MHMNICLFTPEEITQPLPLKDERARHIIKVLHKTSGDTFSAGIIGCASGTATITSITDGTLSFTFTAEGDGKPLYPLVMIIGFPRPIQLKRLLRDMASLGVSEVHLTATQLGEKSYLQSDLATTDAGYRMLLDGSAQAASTHIPQLRMHQSLKECLSYLQTAHADAQHLLALDNVRAAGSLNAYLSKSRNADCAEKKQTESRNADRGPLTIAAIGSERGWTDEERSLLEQAGYQRLSMGSRILRTETAATTAASLILGAGGYLG